LPAAEAKRLTACRGEFVDGVVPRQASVQRLNPEWGQGDGWVFAAGIFSLWWGGVRMLPPPPREASLDPENVFLIDFVVLTRAVFPFPDIF